MISRESAMKALRMCNYERFSITPSIHAMRKGIQMNVYAAREVRKTYAYGENGKIHGYIMPIGFLQNHDAIRKMIGYSGKIIIIDSEGNHV